MADDIITECDGINKYDVETGKDNDDQDSLSLPNCSSQRSQGSHTISRGIGDLVYPHETLRKSFTTFLPNEMVEKQKRYLDWRVKVLDLVTHESKQTVR
ncbi:hypothetical protein ACTXT7_012267 [Hymenolepis weldensis]